MIRSVLLFSLLIIAFSAAAQMQKGVVVDGESGRPLYNATLSNMTTRQVVTTDEEGNFSIKAANGEIITFSYPGYHTIERLAVTQLLMTAELFPLSVNLKPFVLHNLTKFQRDSIEMTTLYSKELNTKTIRPSFSSANGGGFSGLIGGPVQRMSKSYKQNQRFKETFQKDLEQKYIDTRYTPALVTTLTGLTGEPLIIFMNSYPMEHSFARAATDLELKMWIRNNYKEYQQKSKNSTH